MTRSGAIRGSKWTGFGDGLQVGARRRGEVQGEISGFYRAQWNGLWYHSQSEDHRRCVYACACVSVCVYGGCVGANLESDRFGHMAVRSIPQASAEIRGEASEGGFDLRRLVHVCFVGVLQ